jgi:peptidyl-prolyl cis-trans isomerase C
MPISSVRSPSRLLAAAAILGTLATVPALAQTSKTPATKAQAPATPAPSTAVTTPTDPVVAKVDGMPIHFSDVRAAISSLPPQAQTMSPQQLYPTVIEQLVDETALLQAARKTSFDKDPAVQRAMETAADRALASAFLGKIVRPQITDEAVKAKYDQEYAGKPGETEVHARHILVNDEATAKKIIAELQKGADFAALSKQYSKDPGASAQGGDLGFFKKSDMVPEFADAAFALKDKEISPVPVKSQFGWHVIQTLERRTTPPPSYEQVRDELRQQLVQAAIQKEVSEAVAAVKVEKFNLDGTPVQATDKAEPPPAK